jgi:hypothetical protein
MTPARFAHAIAVALGRVLPDGFAASADGEHLTLEAPDGSGASTVVLVEPDEAEDPDVWADEAERLLSFAQDVVSEAVGATWPGGDGAAPDLPIPGTRVDGATVRLWYGDGDAPVLAVGAIDLESVRRSGD